jgi:hypothetical protein
MTRITNTIKIIIADKPNPITSGLLAQKTPIKPPIIQITKQTESQNIWPMSGQKLYSVLLVLFMHSV